MFYQNFDLKIATVLSSAIAVGEIFIYRTYSNNWDIYLSFKTNDRPATKIPLPWNFELWTFLLKQETFENISMCWQKKKTFYRGPPGGFFLL